MDAGFRYQVDWGDGTSPEVIEPIPGNGAGVSPRHVYAAEGVYALRVTAADQNGAVSPEGTHTITVSRVALLDDPLYPGQSMLVVGGTTQDDDIRLRRGPRRGDVVVRMNRVNEGVFRPTSRLIVYGYDGADNINVASAVRLPAWLYGGAGNDDLTAGGGPAIILGGEGDDDLRGRNARDLLIGGLGADLRRGGRGHDLLIAGTTTFDDNEATLAAIQAEWLSANSNQTRLANIRTRFLVTDGSNRTVFDDNAVDILIGDQGQDAYLANLDAGVLDTVFRPDLNEELIDVD
jgi:Ca2+-binding RTX toxin-like protein